MSTGVLARAERLKQRIKLKQDMIGEDIDVNDWVAIHTSNSIRILRICKITPKMVVVEYFTPKRKERKTLHLYAKDMVKVNSESVFKTILSS